MKVNAIGNGYVANLKRNKVNNTPVSQPIEQPAKMTKLSFRGGKAEHVLHIVAEKPPYSKKGGVATVANDYVTLPIVDANTNGTAAFAIPYYNGTLTYDESGALIKDVGVLTVPDSLPEGHPLKGKEGKPIYTGQDLDKKPLVEVLKGTEGKDFWILEEVASKTMEWGFDEAVPIKLFRVPNTNDFMVYTEGTASMKVPYEGGGYATSSKPFAASWQGDTYARFNKAAVELMQDLSNNMKDFDPGTVVCSDSQASYVSHFMAQRSAAGEEYFQVKKPTQVLHNGGDGYIGMTSPRNMLVNLTNKQELEKIVNSTEYLDALRKGEEDQFILKLLGDILETDQKSVSALDVPIFYANHGYVPMISTVTEKYADAVVDNPEIAPSLGRKLKQLRDKGRFIGINNPLNDPNLAADKPLPGFMPGYGVGAKVKLSDGTEVDVKPFRAFDSDKLTDLAHVKEVKNENKMNIFDRLSGKYDGADKFALVVAGKDGASVKVHGGINPKYIEKIKNGEDVRLFVSWGRGDFQKAQDTVMDAFVKYVELTGDENAVFISGGALEEGTPDATVIKNKIDELIKNPKMEGRFAFMEGFAPGLALASAADMAILPSRTAPCELTDLEAMRKLCTPNVTNCQGLAQKNFDPEGKNADAANAYVTQHEFFMTEEEALAATTATAAAVTAFTTLKSKLTSEIKTKFKNRTGSEITDEQLKASLQKDEKYQKALKALRDDIVSNELAANMKRKKEETVETAQKILKNQAEMKTSWENNGHLSKTNQSSGERYRNEHFKKQGEKISEKEALQDKIKNKVNEFIKKAKGDEPGGKDIKSKSSSMKKYLGIGAAIIAGLGIGYYFFNKKSEQKNDGEKLSCSV